MSPTPRKKGPRPLPARERRSYMLHVTITEAERKAMLSAAGLVPFSTWARSILLEAVKKAK